MAEVKKSVAGLKQTEITIVEERLSTPYGTLSIDIAEALSNRFDRLLDEIKKESSQRTYTDKIKNKDDRRKKIADIESKVKKLKLGRAKNIGEWHKKVLAYIEKEYGSPIKDGNGTSISYGDRVEIMKNKNLKKIW